MDLPDDVIGVHECYHLSPCSFRAHMDARAACYALIPVRVHLNADAARACGAAGTAPDALAAVPADDFFLTEAFWIGAPPASERTARNEDVRPYPLPVIHGKRLDLHDISLYTHIFKNTPGLCNRAVFVYQNSVCAFLAMMESCISLDRLVNCAL